MRVPARNPGAAWERYRRFLQLPLTCLSATAQWYTGREQSPEAKAMLTQPDIIPISLEDGSRLFLAASQLFSIIPDDRHAGEYKASTKGYSYTVTNDDRLSDEVATWHWHPETRADPHIHVAADHAAFGPLAPLHLPTARVSFEAIVRFLVEDGRARPAREDWHDVLGDTEARFREYRTWHDRPPESVE